MQPKRPQAPWRVGIVVLSDRASRGERADACGPALRQRVIELGFDVAFERVLPDGLEPLALELARLADASSCELLLTAGGTGLSPRDLTPEATRRIAEREVPGLMELARRRCAERTPFAALSRGLAVSRGRTLLINLPGHPRAALETLDAIAELIPHALAILTAPPLDCPLTGQSGEESA